jgi:hypothetical protein
MYPPWVRVDYCIMGFVSNFYHYVINELASHFLTILLPSSFLVYFGQSVLYLMFNVVFTQGI